MEQNAENCLLSILNLLNKTFQRDVPFFFFLNYVKRCSSYESLELYIFHTIIYIWILICYNKQLNKHGWKQASDTDGILPKFLKFVSYMYSRKKTYAYSWTQLWHLTLNIYLLLLSNENTNDRNVYKKFEIIENWPEVKYTLICPMINQ